MKKLALLLLVSSTAYADVTLAYESKIAATKDKTIAVMKKEGPAHQAALDKASNGKAFTVTVTVNKLDQTADSTTCRLNIMIGAPGNGIAATMGGGATTKSGGDTGIEDCVGAVLGNMLDHDVTKTISEKAKK